MLSAARALLLASSLVVGCSSGPIALGRLDETSSAISDAGSTDGAAPSLADGSSACDVPRPNRHYAFDGVGTVVVDRIGGPSGEIRGGAMLDGTGSVRLDGVDDYVDLPNGLLAGKSELAVAVWVRHLGGPAAYKRVLDIGTTRDGEDPAPGTSTAGQTYFAIATATGNVPPGLAVLMSAGGSQGEVVALSDVVLDKEMRFVVASVSADAVSLYHEGRLVARVPRSVDLSAIADANAWLGRSQYTADGYFESEYADVRIYDRGLGECEVRKLYAEGSSPP